jgi:hypothetical protein
MAGFLSLAIVTVENSVATAQSGSSLAIELDWF